MNDCGCGNVSTCCYVRDEDGFPGVDWVFLGPNGECICSRCDARYIINMPVPLDIMIAIIRVFGMSHRDCPPK